MRQICYLWKFSVQHLLSFNQNECPENLQQGTDKSIFSKESREMNDGLREGHFFLFDLFGKHLTSITDSNDLYLKSTLNLPDWKQNDMKKLDKQGGTALLLKYLLSAFTAFNGQARLYIILLKMCGFRHNFTV